MRLKLLSALTNSVPRGCSCAAGEWVSTVSGGGVVAQRVVTEEQAEVSRLRREVAELRMERDILKKATAYFATESLRGTR